MLLRFILSLLIAVTLCACGDSGNAAIERTEDACQTACEFAVPLSCSSEEGLTQQQCEARCVATYRAVPACQSKYLALSECVAAQPVENWECNDVGEADVVAGVCDAEYAELDNCMSSS